MLRRIFLLLCSVLLVGMVSSCGNANLLIDSDDEVISVVTWNAQTFFDGVVDGCEYSDFKKSGNWNNEKYQERLKRLCSVITELDADIFVLEELENEGIIYDINNHLAGKNWNRKNYWEYSCFAKPDFSAIGCGILSKFKLKDCTTHGLDIRVQNSEQPGMRYLMEVTVEHNKKELKVFANHWKSKSGGQEESEIWRDWQESVLAGRLLKLNNEGEPEDFVLCGDFNRDAKDFIHSGNIIRLRNAGFGNQYVVNTISPWFSEYSDNSLQIGSYYYQNEWEKIDHIFISENLKIISFFPCVNSAWTTSNGTPFSYSISTGNGYSDHLPVKASIRLH